MHVQNIIALWHFIRFMIFCVRVASYPSNGDVRLAGYGATHLWGRLEIYLNDTWGTICDDTFHLKEADVACRQMGLGYAINYRPGSFQRLFN